MNIESPSFTNNQPIPKKYTCHGEDVSPPLTFSDVPDKAISLALIVDDPDAPSGTFDHWLVWNIPATTQHLSEGAKVPREGTNSFRETRYRGPCPPKGRPHHYFFKLYALDKILDIKAGSSKSDLEKAMKGHTLGQAQLIGLYQSG